MGNKLLVRMYNVEVGDCIYVRIPNGGNEFFHMLIDCGSKGKSSLLADVVKELEKALPESDEQPGKKRLDLIVVTHEHEDHIKGFDPEFFRDMDIRNIWMTSAMDPDHEQAETTRNLHQFAATEMRKMSEKGLALSPELEDLMSVFGINNEGALNALRRDFEVNPQYVHSGMTSDDLGIDLKEAKIRILGPERDIDHFYLGKEVDQQLQGLQSFNNVIQNHKSTEADAIPKNISLSDFQKLQSRILSNSFAFAELASRVKNNTCVVFLLEWGNRRLLFVGDTEWEGEFEEGKRNGGWNVMWNQQKDALNEPIDFLKIGHHGSTNSTPWNDRQDGQHTEPGDILDSILPADGENKHSAIAIASTRRKNYKTIPKAALLTEIGKRVSNTRKYFTELRNAGEDPTKLRHYETQEKQWLDQPQPWRTDLENMIDKGTYVQVEFEKKTAS